MFSKQKRITLTAALVCLSLIFLAGCSNKMTEPMPAPAPENTTTPAPAPVPEPNATITPEKMNDLSAESQKIADAVVKDVPDVEDATIVISEKMAYAAIKIRDTADTGKAEEIKKQVIAKIKETDPNITDAYVSEDADTFTRVKAIGQDIANGKPLSGFVAEMENLFMRVTPTK